MTLADNSTRSSGNTPGVLVRTRGDLVAVGNHVFHAATLSEPNAVALEVTTPSATLTSNRLPRPWCLDPAQGSRRRRHGQNAYAVLGNITPARIDYAAPGQGTDNRWEPLNPVLPE